MNKTFSSKQVLISLGVLFLISSVSNAYDADQHEAIIKSRCSSLKSYDEVIGCFNNDVTVIEQIRRRERQEARDAFKARQGSSSQSSAPARQRPSQPIDNGSDDVRPAPQKPAPVAVKPTPKPAPSNPVVTTTPTPAPRPPAPVEAKPPVEPALINGQGTAPVVDNSTKKPEGDPNRIRDIFKDGRESENVFVEVDGKQIPYAEFKKLEAAKEAAAAKDGAAKETTAAIDAPIKEEATKEIAKEEAKKPTLWERVFGPSTKEESKKVATEPAKEAGKKEDKETKTPDGIIVDSSDKYTVGVPKPDDKAGQDRPHIMDSAKEAAKADVKGDAKPVEKAAEKPAPVKVDENSTTVAKGTQAPKASDPAGKICHSGGDKADYHCHDAVTELDKPKRDLKAEEQAAKTAEATAPTDTCSKWKSPMRGKHRLTDCIGSKRNGSRKHAGVDLGNGQQPNTGIYSVGKGKIIQAGWMGGYGCVIQVQHDECPGPLQAYPNFSSDKCVSFYAHLQTAGGGKCPMAGKAGTQVNSCTKLGIMGGTGGNYAKHLHFEMRLKRQSGVRINPIVALGKELREGAGNANACSGTQGWLAATGNGAKTHSVKSSTSTSRQAAARQ